jgi:hypothetical protein
MAPGMAPAMAPMRENATTQTPAPATLPGSIQSKLKMNILKKDHMNAPAPTK